MIARISTESVSRLMMVAVLAAATLAISLTAGCNDDSADMAAQIQAQGARRPAGAPPGGAPEGSSPGGESAKPGGPPKPGAPAKPGMPGMPGKPGEAPAAGEPGKEGEAAAEEPAGPQIELVMKNLKAPYPRFSGAGYYDFDLEVTALEAVEAKVWEIQALDAEGKVVGSQKQMMVFVKDRMKEFAFRGFYCSTMPSDVKLIFTGKDAVPIDSGDGQSHGGGKGAELGGGSGSKGGGGSGGGSGSGGSSGGESGGDEGGKEGGDEGGE